MNSTIINRKATCFSVILLTIMFLFAESSVHAADFACLNLNKTLNFAGNQKAEEVTALQNFLFSKKYLTVTVRGYFGRTTEAAVKKFQKDNGIDPNGVVGPLTRAKIKSITCDVVTKPVINQVASVVVAENIVKETTPPSPKKFSLPYSSTNLSDWTPEFGKISTSTGVLSMEATGDLTIAQVFYKPAQELKDYSYTANVFMKRGIMILMARYINDKNFVGCAFVGRNIDIIQRINGEQKTLTTINLPDSPYVNFFFDDLNLTMKVKGQTVGCTMLGNESNVEYKNFDSSLSKGAVGAQVWFESPGVAGAEIKKVTIESI